MALGVLVQVVLALQCSTAWAAIKTINVGLVGKTGDELWSPGIRDFFTPHLNQVVGGFKIADDTDTYNLKIVDYHADFKNQTADIDTFITAVTAGKDYAGNAVGGIDAVVVADSSINKAVMAALEPHKIPNLHCSGGNPAMWTAETPHAFGMHLPFPWYSRGPIRQASLLGLKTMAIIRDWDWGFPKISGKAAREWARESSFTVIGPTVAWCNKYADQTVTCKLHTVDGKEHCRCGEQSEYDELGYKVDVLTMTSFYEVSEKKVLEDYDLARKEFISPNLVTFMEGVIDDIRSQTNGADPEVFVNWLGAARSGLIAAWNKKLAYKVYFGGPNYKGTSWNGYEGYWLNGTQALDHVHAMYNSGGGQWHEEMEFSDPYFVKASAANKLFMDKYNKAIHYDTAACIAAGITISYGLQKYGESMMGKTQEERRRNVRISVGNMNDETMFGSIRFNRYNQNNARFPVNWQVLEDGATRPVLPAESAATPFRYPVPSWDSRFGCPAGTYASGPDSLSIPVECVPCPEGTFTSTIQKALTKTTCSQCAKGTGTLPGKTGTAICDNCPAGRFQDGGITKGVCTECLAGTFMAGEGAEKCDACPKGMHMTGVGAKVCTACASGKFAENVGTIDCANCPRGQFQNETGQTACKRCIVGTYADQLATSECTKCPGTFTTDFPGAQTKSECACGLNTYSDTNNNCLPCPAGMTCGFAADIRNLPGAGGSGNYPMASPGYMTLTSDPMKVFKCLMSKACPGGPPGTCDSPEKDSTQIACAICKDGYFEADGACEKCEGASALPLFLGLIVGWGFVAFLTLDGNKLLLNESQIALTFGMMLGILINASQTLGIFGELEMDYFSPLSDVLDGMGLLGFDITILNAQCVLGNAPVAIYTGRQMVGPICIPMIFATVIIKKMYYKGKQEVVILPEVLNTIGGLFCEFFIAIVVSATAPFVCYPHPGNSGKSMQSSPSVLCFEEGDHGALVGVAVVAVLLIPIPFCSSVLYATWRFPKCVMNVDRASNLFMRATRFLFLSFTPTGYSYAAMLLLKNLLVCLVPIIFGGDGGLQVVALCLILQGFLIQQQQVNPWRTPWCNVLDGVVNVVVVLLLISGAVAADLQPDVSALSALVALMFILASLVILIPLLYTGYHRYIKKDAGFGFVICHNKGNAASQALLLKALLQQQTGKQVLIDSNDFSKIDNYLEAVRNRPDQFLCYLTPGSLTKPTCIAQLVLAFHKGVNVTAIKTPGFIPPSEDQLNNLVSYIDMSGCSLLTYGVDLENAGAAIKKLLSSETTNIEMDDSLGGVSRLHAVVDALLPESPKLLKQGEALPSKPGMVVLSAEPHTDEAISAAAYIKMGLGMEDVCCLADYDIDADTGTSLAVKSRAIIVLLSGDTLKSPTQLSVVVNTMQTQAEAKAKGEDVMALIPVILPSFRFPTSDRFYDDVLATVWSGRDYGVIKDLVKSFQRLDAIPFPTLGEEAKLHWYIEKIKARIPENISEDQASLRRVTSRTSFAAKPSEANATSV